MTHIMRHLMTLCERATNVPVNSLGKPIATSPEGLSNFQRWFGRSKVVDPEGRPLVVYHGTNADIQAFDPARSSKQGGIPIDYHPSYFFTALPDVAQSYAKQRTEPLSWRSDDDADEHLRLMQAGDYDAARRLSKAKMVKNAKTWGAGANVMPVYLRMLKPLRASGKGNYWNEIWFDGDFMSTRDLIEFAIEKGHDGIIVKNVHDRGEGKGKPSTIYAVFSPNQIKSAVGNSGAFADNELIGEAAGAMQIVPVLYHGTCEDNAAHLIQHGWHPHSGTSGGNQGQTRYLYLSTDREDALWFAQEKGCDTVLAVRNIPLDCLIVDPEDGIGDSVEAEMNLPHGLPGKLALTKPLAASHFQVAK